MKRVNIFLKRIATLMVVAATAVACTEDAKGLDDLDDPVYPTEPEPEYIEGVRVSATAIAPALTRGHLVEVDGVDIPTFVWDAITSSAEGGYVMKTAILKGDDTPLSWYQGDAFTTSTLTIEDGVATLETELPVCEDDFEEDDSFVGAAQPYIYVMQSASDVVTYSNGSFRFRIDNPYLGSSAESYDATLESMERGMALYATGVLSEGLTRDASAIGDVNFELIPALFKVDVKNSRTDSDVKLEKVSLVAYSENGTEATAFASELFLDASYNAATNSFDISYIDESSTEYLSEISATELVVEDIAKGESESYFYISLPSVAQPTIESYKPWFSFSVRVNYTISSSEELYLATFNVGSDSDDDIDIASVFANNMIEPSKLYEFTVEIKGDDILADDEVENLSDHTVRSSVGELDLIMSAKFGDDYATGEPLEKVEVLGQLTQADLAALQNVKELILGEAYIIDGDNTNILPANAFGNGDDASLANVILERIVLPATLTDTGQKSFENCTSLKEVVLPSEGNFTINNRAFKYSGLTSLVIPSNCKQINYAAFEECTSLESLEIMGFTNASTTAGFGGNAFWNCSALKYITLYWKSVAPTVTNNVFPTSFRVGGANSILVPADITVTDLYTDDAGWSVYSLTQTPYGTEDDDDDDDKDDSVVGDNIVESTLGGLNAAMIVEYGENYLSSTISVAKVKGSFTTSELIYLQNIKDLDLSEATIDGNAITANAFGNGDDSSLANVILERIVLPAALTNTGQKSFENCTSLKEVVLPSEGNFTIDNRAFKYSGLTSLVIPSNCKQINYAAFEGCASLGSLEIMGFTNSVETAGLGDNSFWDCTALTDITLHFTSLAPNVANNVFPTTFRVEGGEYSILVPENITVADVYTDAAGWSVYSLTQTSDGTPDPTPTPDNIVASTADGLNAAMIAEYGDDYLSSTIDYTKVTGAISTADLAYLQNIKSLDLSEVTVEDNKISQGSFSTAFAAASTESGNAVLQSIVLPTSLVTIDTGAFANCSALTSVTLPTSSYTIGNNAFKYSALTSISISSNCTSIGYAAFMGCESLTTVTIDTVGNYGTDIFSGCKLLSSVTLPSTLTTIRQSIFMSCSSLTSINIPSSVTSIEANAFRSSALTSVTLPDGLLSIGEAAFMSTALTEVEIPASVLDLSAATTNGVFAGCASLTKVTVQWEENPTAVNAATFPDSFKVDGANSIVVPDDITIADIYTTALGWDSYNLSQASSSTPDPTPTPDNIVASTADGLNAAMIAEYGDDYLSSTIDYTKVTGAISTADLAYLQNIKSLDLSEVTVEGNVLPTEAFGKADDAANANTVLQNIVLPATLTSTGEKSFEMCTSLTSVTFPTGDFTIANRAFKGSGLTSVVIPSNCISLSYRSFYQCLSLGSVEVNALGTISGEVFSECSAITNAVVGAGVTALSDKLFYNTTQMTSITLPSSLVSLGSCVFQNSALSSISLPDGLESIGSGAFFGCASLTEVEIPASVTTLATTTPGMFWNCSALKTLKVNWTDNVPAIGDYFLPNTFKTDTDYTILVPDGIDPAVVYGGDYWTNYNKSQNTPYVVD